jgi:protein O-mannosyl-transferase
MAKPANKTAKNIQNNRVSTALPANKPANITIGLILIITATVIVYLPIFNNSITNWDDDGYIANNLLIKELSVQNVKQMFTGEKSYYIGNYHPLTILSLAIDYNICNNGTEITPHVWMFQLTNLFLHTLNTSFVFFLILLIFRQLKNQYASHIALFSALLFGVHTLHVESVAWMSERKDVLYALFFLLSLVAYLKYLSREKWLWLGLSYLLFVLSLFSKGQAVSLALTLLAVDFIWGRKLLSFKVIIEKLPYFVLAVIFGIIAIKAQSAGEAVQDIADYQFYEGVLFASYGFTMYLLKLILPISLSAYYPYVYGTGNVPATYFAFPLVVGAIVFVFVKCLQKTKEISFGIAFFVLNIALLLQLIPVGSAIMADRYVYIPSIGFFLLVAVFYAKILSKGKNQGRIANIIAVFYISLLMVLTFNRTQVWKDGQTLWADATNKEPSAPVAWNNLGSANIDAGNLVEALQNLDMALKLDNRYAKAWLNRGTAKKNYGDKNKDAGYWRGALEDYNEAIELKPEFPEAYFSRGIVKDLLGDVQGEIDDFKKAIDQKLDGPKAYINHGIALGKSGRLDEAIADFNKALSIDANCAEAYENRGIAEFQQAKYREALKDYGKAIEIKPDLSDAFYHRGLAENELKEYKSAIADFNTVVAQKPDFFEVYLSRGGSYMGLQQYQEALKNFDIAIKASPTWANPYYQKYLAFRILKSKEQACQVLIKAVELGADVSTDDERYCNIKVVDTINKPKR